MRKRYECLINIDNFISESKLLLTVLVQLGPIEFIILWKIAFMQTTKM